MKNIHVLATDKPSRLYFWENKLRIGDFITAPKNLGISNQNIYITNDEKIKEGDWVVAIEGIWKNIITKVTGEPIADVWRKIILTTDQDLIKDGIQAIDDEFLEWFVKNSSCEFVEVEPLIAGFIDGEVSYYEGMYKIIIPKEEPKQETLEEACEKYFNKVSPNICFYDAAKFGAKWQQQQNNNLYSKEDMWESYKASNTIFEDEIALRQEFEKWFNQFKKQ